MEIHSNLFFQVDGVLDLLKVFFTFYHGKLGGGFEYFSFSPLPGEIIQFD